MSTWQSVRSARTYILLASVSVFLSAELSPLVFGAVQQSPSSPTATPEELQTYGAFRTWITSQPADVQKADDDVIFQRYSAALRTQGKSERDIATTIASLKAIAGYRFTRRVTGAGLTAQSAPWAATPLG